MRVLVVVLLFGVLVGPAEGQTIWSRPYEPNQLAVEAIVPEAENASVLSGATFFSGSLSLNDNVELAAELPVARYDPTADGASTTTAIGNPYVGLGFSSTRIPLLFQLGARIPTAPSNVASRLGESGDVGRVPAFRPEEFSLTGLLNGRLPLARNSTLRLRAGLGYASRPDGPTNRDWRLHYDVQVWREGERLVTGLSVTGRALLTRPGTTQHHAALSVMTNWTRVQPGLVVGTSLNDLVQNEAFTPFAGVTLSVTYMR
jgi:hypothetical protein